MDFPSVYTRTASVCVKQTIYKNIGNRDSFFDTFLMIINAAVTLFSHDYTTYVGPV